MDEMIEHHEMEEANDDELTELDEKIANADNRVQIAFQNHPDCRRIASVEGVGPRVAPLGDAFHQKYVATTSGGLGEPLMTVVCRTICIFFFSHCLGALAITESMAFGLVKNSPAARVPA